MEEDNKKESKKIMVSVLPLKIDGDVAFIQWLDGKRRKRGFIPTSELKEDKVDKDTLEMATPFGIPFADLITMKATSQQLEDKLYDAGIWTLEDLTANSRILPGVLQSVYAVDMVALFTAARNYNK